MKELNSVEKETKTIIAERQHEDASSRRSSNSSTLNESYIDDYRKGTKRSREINSPESPDYIYHRNNHRSRNLDSRRDSGDEEWNKRNDSDSDTDTIHHNRPYQQDAVKWVNDDKGRSYNGHKHRRQSPSINDYKSHQSPSTEISSRRRSSSIDSRHDRDDRYRSRSPNGNSSPSHRRSSPYYSRRHYDEKDEPYERRYIDDRRKYRRDSYRHNDYYYGNGDRRRWAAGQRYRSRSPEDSAAVAERDSRTVFVQQLSARLRSRELKEFFETAGPVRDAQIVTDRLTGRSKGVGYVEFREVASVQKAIEMTGQKLLGIPVIVQLTEAEKNRQAKESGGSRVVPGKEKDVLKYRVSISNVHYGLTEDDIRQVFEPTGEVEHVFLQKDRETGRHKGYGFVQFRNQNSVTEAIDAINGRHILGRPIKVASGNERIVIAENIARSTDTNKATHQIAADTTSSIISRENIIKKLLREEDKIPPNSSNETQYLLMQNMFDPAEETEPNWSDDLKEDVIAECEKKYGKILSIFVDTNSKGDIFVEFKTKQNGIMAFKELNGRWFGGRKISTTFLNSEDFKNRTESLN